MLIKPVLSNVPSQYGRVSLASPVSVIVRVQEDDSGRVQHVRLASSSYFLVLLLKNFHPVVGGKKRSSSPSTTFTSAFNQERCPSSPTSHSFPDLGVDRRDNGVVGVGGDLTCTANCCARFFLFLQNGLAGRLEILPSQCQELAQTAQEHFQHCFFRH